MFVRRRASGTVFIACLLASGGLRAQSSPAATMEVPAGQTCTFCLRQTISWYGSEVDTPISAVLSEPVEINGHIVLPLNAALRGTVARVRRIGIGFSHETALIDLRFDTLTIPGGEPQPLAGRVSAVDNSRETVDDKGVIHGIRAPATTSKVISGLAISAASLDPMSHMFAASASLSAFRILESAIILPVGTELTYKLETPITVQRQFPGPEPFVRSEDQERQLSDFNRPLPFRTETAHPVTPADLITLLYVGSQDSINRAFDAAGWAAG